MKKVVSYLLKFVMVVHKAIGYIQQDEIHRYVPKYILIMDSFDV